MIYQCLIRGENFPGILIGKQYLVGFYTTRWIEATDEAAAEQLVLERLKKETIFDAPDGHRSGRAKVYFDEIVTVDCKPKDIVEVGATWFPMEEQREQSESECKT